ncbi:MAG: hypothetical protein AAF821_26460 [Cyanobacteria bacterium P01_D01_bin.156]
MALHIVEILEERGSDIELMSRSTNNLEVPIAKIGCFELDIWLCYFRYGLSVEGLVNRGVMPWWIVPYRVILWGNHGLFKVSEDFISSFPESIQLDNDLKPQPGDGIVIEEDFPPQGYQYPCIDDYVPPAHIIHAAHRLDEPLMKTVQRFQKFAAFGLRIPEIDVTSLKKIEISEEDIIALSRRVDEVVDLFEKDKISWRKPWIEDEISASQIILTSTRLNESIADSLRRFEKFKSIGLKMVDSCDNKEIAKIKINPEDIIALSRNLDGEEAWPSNYISPAQIAFSAKRLNESVVSTLRRFDEFRCIGLTLPKVNPEKLDNFKATEEDFIALSEGDITDRTAWPEKQISVAQIVQASWRLKEPLDEVLNRLKRFIPLGLSVPDIDLITIKNISVVRNDSILFSDASTSTYKERKRTWLDNTVTPIHVVAGAVKLNEPVADVLKQFQKFSPLGIKFQPMDLEGLQALVNSEEDLLIFARNLTKDIDGPRDLLQGEIHPTRIILAALALKEPINKTLERFRQHAQILDLKLPKGEPDTWKICLDKSTTRNINS